MYDLSVIVPTHNRKEYLPDLLTSLAAQDYPADRWELVLVDDGSSDDTPDYLKAYKGARPANMCVILQSQSGVATARNNASRVAKGRALLFLDDDMIASPRLVAEHAEVHLQDAEAVVVGHLSVPWSNRAPWVAWEDWQLMRHFEALASGRRVPGPRDFYSGNCSVSAEQFKRVSGYDTSLPRTEDVELGYRLRDAGARFYYRGEAESLHLGKHTYEGWLRNARLYGRCDVILAWEKAHVGLQGEIFRWYHLRNSLNRALVSTCIRVPALQGPAIKVLDLLGRAGYRLGAHKVSRACYSAIYNLAYWVSVSHELGRERFWEGVRGPGAALSGHESQPEQAVAARADR